MAQRKAPATSRNNRSANTNVKRAGAKVPNTKRVAPQPEEEQDPLLVRIWAYSWGKVLYLILGILVLIGLDLLIAMNKYNLFFMVLGVEIILAMLVSWVVFLIVDRRKRMSDENDEEVSDGE